VCFLFAWGNFLATATGTTNTSTACEVLTVIGKNTSTGFFRLSEDLAITKEPPPPKKDYIAKAGGKISADNIQFDFRTHTSFPKQATDFRHLR